MSLLTFDVAGVVLGQKRAASAADETQIHHDSCNSYALLIQQCMLNCSHFTSLRVAAVPTSTSL